MWSLVVLPVSAPELLLAFAVTFVAATLQGTVGFGFAVISVPVLALIDPKLSPVPQLLLGFPLCVWVFWRERNEVRWRQVGWILAGRFPGAALGLWLLATFSDRWLDGLIAGVVMFAVIVLATGRDLPRNRVTEFTAGLASGTFALVASIGGPPIALLYRNAKGPTLRSNLAAVFIVGLLITIGTRVLADRLTTSDVVVAAFLLPAILLAGIASGPLAKRIEGSVLRVTVLLVASLAAVGLFWRTFA